MSILGRLRSGSAALGALLSAALIVSIHGDCGAPPRLASAEPRQLQEGTEGFSPGSVVHYVCRPGFGRNPRTRDSFVCADGRWSGPSDMCKPRPCTFPGEPNNGRLVLPASFTFGSTVNFTCDTG
ncbi:complement decay-accelerating factor-like, partial [Malurus melanocephalus]|uniref:complement decay-accelerating factor-like n=1 Tax=Malurus melanocephalus TaxID=175006 RepID=UPI0025491C3B